MRASIIVLPSMLIYLPWHNNPVVLKQCEASLPLSKSFDSATPPMKDKAINTKNVVKIGWLGKKYRSPIVSFHIFIDIHMNF